MSLIVFEAFASKGSISSVAFSTPTEIYLEFLLLKLLRKSHLL